MNIRKGDVWYFARIIPRNSIYEVCELKIRTITEDYIVGIDKHDKHAHLINNLEIPKLLFKNRKDALSKVKLAEKGDDYIV